MSETIKGLQVLTTPEWKRLGFYPDRTTTPIYTFTQGWFMRCYWHYGQVKPYGKNSSFQKRKKQVQENPTQAWHTTHYEMIEAEVKSLQENYEQYKHVIEGQAK